MSPLDVSSCTFALPAPTCACTVAPESRSWIGSWKLLFMSPELVDASIAKPAPRGTTSERSPLELFMRTWWTDVKRSKSASTEPEPATSDVSLDRPFAEMSPDDVYASIEEATFVMLMSPLPALACTSPPMSWIWMSPLDASTWTGPEMLRTSTSPLAVDTVMCAAVGTRRTYETPQPRQLCQVPSETERWS